MKKIKPLKLYNMNYLDGVFKPMFENKLECNGLVKVTFKVNLKNDTFEMEGVGIPRGKISLDMNLKCVPMKVSENLNYKVMLDRNVYKNIPDCKEYFIAYVTIDYSQRVIFTEVWYLSKADAKNYQKFQNKF